MRERLKLDREPRKLRVESEPYVKYVGRAFVPALDVLEIKNEREYFIIISPQSISQPLKAWMDENDGTLMHLEFWINKASEDRFSQYELELS